MDEIIKILDVFQIYIKSPVILLDDCCGFRFNGKSAPHKDLRIAFGTSKGNHSVSSDEMKKSMFCWVYDTKNETNMAIRRDFLYDKAKSKYPDFNVFLAVFSTKFSWAQINCCGFCEFEDYGGYILIALF